jgi:hypothetical protein
MTDWDPRPIEDIEAEARREAVIAAALDFPPDPDAEANATRRAIERQLILLGVFLVCLAILFAFAGTVLASGGGCGGP